MFTILLQQFLNLKEYCSKIVKKFKNPPGLNLHFSVQIVKYNLWWFILHTRVLMLYLVLQFIQSPDSYSFDLLFLFFIIIIIIIIIINRGGQSIPHFSFLVKKEVFSVECRLIVIDLTTRDGKGNTTRTIGALVELSQRAQHIC